MQVNVLAVRQWKFTDESSGEMKKGVSVHYFDSAENLDSPVEKGVFPRKITGGFDLFKKFSKLPGKYEFDIKLKSSAGGRTGVELEDVSLVQ